MGRWLPPLLWALLIFLGSSIPGSAIPGKVSAASISLHIFEYALLSVLILRAWPSSSLRQVWSGAVWVVAVSVLYAASDEIHQVFVPGRHVDVRDLMADVAGIGVGLIIWHWWRRVSVV